MQKSATDILGQRKICVPVAAALIVHEYPANSTRSLAVWNIEIFIRPCFQPRIQIGPVRIQMRLLRGMEMGGIFVIFDTRVQI